VPFGHTSPAPFGHTSPAPFGHTSPAPFGGTLPKGEGLGVVVLNNHFSQRSGGVYSHQRMDILPKCVEAAVGELVDVLALLVDQTVG